MSGLQLSDLVGQHDQDILPHEVTDAYLSLLALARQTLRPQQQHRVVPLPDSDYTVILNYVPILDPEGGLRQIIGVTQDLTEHTRIQNELARREAQMRAIFNNSTQAFLLIDLAGTVLTFNPIASARMQVISGRALEVGASVYDYLIPPWRDEMIAALEQVLGGQSVSMERNLGTEQAPLWFSCDFAPISAEGQGVIGICVSALDTTIYHAAVNALARSEERWRALVQHASDGMLVLDLEGVLQFSSPALERILGHPLDQMIGVNTMSVLHPDDRDQTRAVRQRLLGSEDATETMTVRARHRDGRWIWLEAICVNLMSNPNIGGIVVTVRDVTERRSLEAQLQHAQRMESIGRLAGGVAHDFNNLLTAILGNAELMLAELPPEHSLRADLELIQHTAERAAGLTRQLLAFARKQVLAPQPLDLSLVVGNMEQLLRRLIGSDVLLVSGLAAGLPQVYADRSQIEQVLINLAVNARDAMPEGGTLTISTALVELGPESPEAAPQQPLGRYVRLSVSDNGQGMSPEVLQHLFEPFFTTKAPGHGTGLGLATSYGIVRQHGGHIQVQSDLGCGTTVSIDLPAMSEPPERRPEPDELASAPRGSETVLVVDDAPAVRTLVSRMLQNQGYKVLEASDGTQALALIASTHGLPDLLITDVVMPHMPGYALADLLTQRYPRLKVLLISGNADLSRGTHQRQHVLHYPVLHKPFGPLALAQTVRAVLDGAPLQIENGERRGESSGNESKEPRTKS
jgi:PAS domain S-box-containing protein